MVGQEPVLFNRSIRENILYAVTESADKQRMVEAAEEANAHEFIAELADGYETKCGQRGGHLSGSINLLVWTFQLLLSVPRWPETTCIHRSSRSSQTDHPSAR